MYLKCRGYHRLQTAVPSLMYTDQIYGDSTPCDNCGREPSSHPDTINNAGVSISPEEDAKRKQFYGTPFPNIQLILDR